MERVIRWKRRWWVGGMLYDVNGQLSFFFVHDLYTHLRDM